MAQCPDCGLSMTQHTLKYYHKKRGHCKGTVQEEVKEELRKREVKINPPKEQAPGLVNPTKSITNITDEVVNKYIK